MKKIFIFFFLFFSLTYANSAVKENETVSKQLYSVEVNDTDVKKQILMIQTNKPWDSDADIEVMNELGYGYDMRRWDEINVSVLMNYPIVLIVNDQGQNFYDEYSQNKQLIENWIKNGGTLMFFSASDGWAGGTLNDTLPGNVGYYKGYDYYNIVNPLSDYIKFTGLKDEDMVGNYCSHGYYDDNLTLYNNENIYDVKIHTLSKKYGNPTTISYKMGKGYVFASTLTWEYSYDHFNDQNVKAFSKKALRKTFEYVVNNSNSLKPPKVFINPNPIMVNVGETFTLTADASDADGYIVSYYWDINNDGNFTEGNNSIELSFDNEGTYQVKVKVIDNDGLFGISTAKVIVKQNAPKVSLDYAQYECKQQSKYDMVFKLSIDGEYVGKLGFDFDNDGLDDDFIDVNTTAAKVYYIEHSYNAYGDMLVAIHYVNEDYTSKMQINVKRCDLGYDVITDEYINNLGDGWYMLGTVKEIRQDFFDNKNIAVVWVYRNNKWSYYIPADVKKGQSPMTNDPEMFPIRKFEGFWILHSNLPNLQ